MGDWRWLDCTRPAHRVCRASGSCPPPPPLRPATSRWTTSGATARSPWTFHSWRFFFFFKFVLTRKISYYNFILKIETIYSSVAFRLTKISYFCKFPSKLTRSEESSGKWAWRTPSWRLPRRRPLRWRLWSGKHDFSRSTKIPYLKRFPQLVGLRMSDVAHRVLHDVVSSGIKFQIILNSESTLHIDDFKVWMRIIAFASMVK